MHLVVHILLLGCVACNAGIIDRAPKTKAKTIEKADAHFSSLDLFWEPHFSRLQTNWMLLSWIGHVVSSFILSE